MNIFLICPVRNASNKKKAQMEDYITQLEQDGNKVYYPARDTNQGDLVGYRICEDNRDAIASADEVHIYWDKDSQGSLFNLGIAFALGKKLVLANADEIQETETKSFSNMIKYWGGKLNV